MVYGGKLKQGFLPFFSIFGSLIKNQRMTEKLYNMPKSEKKLVWLAWGTHFSVGFFSKQILLRRDFLKAIDTKATGKEILVAILYSIKLDNFF